MDCKDVTMMREVPEVSIRGVLWSRGQGRGEWLVEDVVVGRPRLHMVVKVNPPTTFTVDPSIPKHNSDFTVTELRLDRK